MTKKEYKYIGVKILALSLLSMLFGAVAVTGLSFARDLNLFIAGLSLFALILLKIPMFIIVNSLAKIIKREVKDE